MTAELEDMAADGQAPASMDVDSIIDRLIGTKVVPPFCEVTAEEVSWILTEVVKLLAREPTLLDVSGPINICGDTHGQFDDLRRIFDMCGLPSHANPYLFLGDYVDRGDQSIEVMVLLLALKLKYPGSIFLLRGNHETKSINQYYGFGEDVASRFDETLFDLFNTVFEHLSLAAIVSKRVFCAHGGLSPHVTDLSDLLKVKKPIDAETCEVAMDVLWADPLPKNMTPDDDSILHMFNHQRNCSVFYTNKCVDEFLERCNLKYIVRAHQCVAGGYELFADGKVVSIFSAPGYGMEGNTAAVMHVKDDLTYTFSQLEPITNDFIPDIDTIVFPCAPDDDDDSDDDFDSEFMKIINGSRLKDYQVDDISDSSDDDDDDDVDVTGDQSSNLSADYHVVRDLPGFENRDIYEEEVEKVRRASQSYD